MAPIDIGGLQHTQWHIDCLACEYARNHSLGTDPSTQLLTFADAADRWLELRKMAGDVNRARFIRDNTLRSDKVYIAALKKEFSGLPLNKFNAIHFRLYQEKRSEKAGAVLINHELQFLKRLLREAGLWTEEMERGYKRLPVRPPDVPRAMTPDEQAHYLDVCASRKEWQLLYWYSLTALNTTCNSCEMRGLKLGDVNLYQNLLYVRQASAKNQYRQREIPLTEQAVWALERLRQRARSLGAIHEAHYLFPYSISEKRWDPARPMSAWGLTRQFGAVSGGKIPSRNMAGDRRQRQHLRVAAGAFRRGAQYGSAPCHNPLTAAVAADIPDWNVGSPFGGGLEHRGNVGRSGSAGYGPARG